ncbi:MAG: hypothetical protein RLP09_18625 [Sandaracinaceae bacterium]
MSLDESLLRPVALMHNAGREHRDVWRRFDRALHAERRRGGSWPSYIHAPPSLGAEVAAATQYRGLGSLAQPHILSALAAWRPTQGIYRFHPTLLEELWRTPLTGELPAELYRSLPEWCVYVETPGRDAGPGKPMHGFFAHLAPGDDGSETLELLFDMRAPFPMLAPAQVLLFGTLEESVKESLRRRVEPDLPSLPAWLDPIVDETVDPLSSILSTLLYLCSESPELRDAEGRREAPAPPTPKAPKRKGQVERLAAAAAPTVWETAYELGRRLQEAQEPDGESGDGKRTVRPHVRRAHWHTYWRGPRDGPRTRSLKWVSPLLINARRAAGPTIRNVGSERRGEA